MTQARRATSWELCAIIASYELTSDLVARVWEMQAHGVVHVHPVLAYGTAPQMAGARATRKSTARICGILS